MEESLSVYDNRTKRQYQIPIHNNSIEARAFQEIRVSPVSGSTSAPGTGLSIYDPGLVNTQVKESAVSSRDQRTGSVTYRGLTVEELWDSDYEDLFHLLVWGSIPSPSQRADIRQRLTNVLQNIPPSVVSVVQSFPKDGVPLPMAIAGLSAWMSTSPEGIPAMVGDMIYQEDPKLVENAVVKVTAAYVAVLGLVSCHRKGVPFRPARANLTFLENMFHMMAIVDPATDAPSPVSLQWFRKACVMVADNGLTQSTFAMIVTASSGTDPFSCLISALSAAWGPLHLGAQEASFRQLQDIKHPDNVGRFLEDVKRRGRRLFGFGHRHLKARDPRVSPLERALKDLKVDPELKAVFVTAVQLDRQASRDPYFQKRGIAANGDFYGCFVLAAMGFETEMRILIAMMPRVIGLMAHWRESTTQGIKLFRPLHRYNGPVDKSAASSKL